VRSGSGPGRQGVTAGSTTSGFVLAVPPAGGVAASEAGLVGSFSGELDVGVGALDVVPCAVVSGDVGCAAEDDASGCAGALGEAEGEAETGAGSEAVAVGDAELFPCIGAAGATTGFQLLGPGAALGAAVCSFSVEAFEGTGSAWSKPGSASGRIPASLASQSPPPSKPMPKQMARRLTANIACMGFRPAT